MAARRSTPGSRPFPHQNFTGGEIGREVSARSDLEIFSRSTESNLNAIPQPFGGIRRRPGTGFIDFTHPLLKSATTYGAHRIIPFKYSDTQSYIISFYDGFLRFHTDAALILDSSYVFAPNILNIFNVGGNQVWLEFTAVHGLVNDERIIIVGCDQTELNGREFLVFVLDTTTIAMSEVATGRFSGAQVTPGSTLNKAYDVAHTYSVSELEDIKYAQTGDTIILTHPSHPPRKLVRGSAHDDWTLSNVSFASSQERPFASSASDPEGSSGKGYEVQYAVTRVGYDGSESLPSFTDWEEEAAPENALGAASDPSMVGIHAETQMRMYPGGPLTGDTIYMDMTFSGANDGNVADEYGFEDGLLGIDEWEDLEVMIEFPPTGDFDQDAFDAVHGKVFTLENPTPLEFPHARQTYTFTASGMTSTPAGTYKVAVTLASNPFDLSSFLSEVALWRVYRRGSIANADDVTEDTRDAELWGLVSEVLSTVQLADSTIVVRQQSPIYVDRAQIGEDYTQGPPVHRKVFSEADEYPFAPEFHEQRLVFGGKNNDPRIVNTSKSAAPFDFNLGHFVQDDGALTFPLIGREGQNIQHLVSAKELIILTDGGEWTANTPGQPLLPGTLAPKEQSTWGSSKIRPITVGNSILFVQDAARKVRELRFQFQHDSFVSEEVSLAARHLFDDNVITDIAYIEEPVGILWCLLADGNMASMTYVQEQGVWAWAHHDFGGTVMSIASIREENETDFLYMLISRTVQDDARVYLERLEKPLNISTCWDNAIQVDSSLSTELSTPVTDYLFGIYDNGDGTFDVELGIAHTWSPGDAFYMVGGEQQGCPDGLYQLGAIAGGFPIRALLIATQWAGSSKYNPVEGVFLPARETGKVFSVLSGLFNLLGETIHVWGTTGLEQTSVVDPILGTATLVIPVSKAVAGMANDWEIRMLKIDEPPGVIGSATKRTMNVKARFIDSQRPDVGDGVADTAWADWPKVGSGDAEIYHQYTKKDGVIATTIPSSYDIDSGQIVLGGGGAGPVYILAVIPEALIGD